VLVAALAAVALGCLFAPAAFAAPDFTWDPVSPLACQEVTFSPSVDTEGAMFDYENNDVFVSTLTHTFATAGTHMVEMTSTNGSPVTHDVMVQTGPPVASFDYSPTQPDPGEWVVFSSISCGDSLTLEWDFNGDSVTDSTAASPAYKFDTPGPHDVTLKVSNGNGTDTDTRTVAVRDPSVPTAAFHRDPAGSVLLETGQEATFTSDSVAAAGSTLSWEIDGVTVGSGTSVTHSFSTPGNHVVRLVVSQTNGESDSEVSSFRVNAPPVPGFVWILTGGQAQLLSTSVDAEGALASEAWELDGDGDFNDAFGSSVSQSFSPGDHDVSLRVTDSDGVTRTVTRTISVPAPAAAPAAPVTPPPLMNPFPTVRLVGLVLPGGARITLLEVRGSPRGASVTVRCTGRGCPFRSRRRIADSGRVRLSNFPRVLLAGARIEVLVRAPKVIGKYAAFRIRAGKRPLRTDRCLMPGASEPTRCA
jgi:PKD repeat protein